jgi:hypothetical protein
MALFNTKIAYPYGIKTRGINSAQRFIKALSKDLTSGKKAPRRVISKSVYTPFKEILTICFNGKIDGPTENPPHLDSRAKYLLMAKKLESLFTKHFYHKRRKIRG